MSITMTVRKMVPDVDHPMIARWWEIRKVCIPLPMELLPRGYLVEEGGLPVAAAFLYVDMDGKWAMTEWLTTNPRVCFSRTLVDCVKYLLDHMEHIARERGCKSILSMVAPGTGEERLLAKIGYQTSEGPAHRMYAKVLRRPELPPTPEAT